MDERKGRPAESQSPSKRRVSHLWIEPKDGQAVTFSHGWPLTADAWENQMFFLVSNGYRSVAHDRRGHGRSDQPSEGNEMATYADDLAQLYEALDLKDAMIVGHSTGGGEVAHYIGRHGSKRRPGATSCRIALKS